MGEERLRRLGVAGQDRQVFGWDGAGGERRMFTIDALCEELEIARSTFNDWRAKGTAPRCIKLPNGGVRIRRSDLEKWLELREEAA